MQVHYWCLKLNPFRFVISNNVAVQVLILKVFKFVVEPRFEHFQTNCIIWRLQNRSSLRGGWVCITSRVKHTATFNQVSSSHVRKIMNFWPQVFS